MKLNIKYILATIILLAFTSITIISLNNIYSKNTYKDEIAINKNIFKNKLLDDVIENFNTKFNNSKFNISPFINKETDSNIYFYSQILNFNEAILIIEYSEFEIKKISFKFTNTDKNNLDDISSIIALLIQISDDSISYDEALKIVINMLKNFENNKDSVTLVYDNNLIYSISINNNNNLEFNIK